uniref:Carboxylic ester hydrolase n=1 Tax=Anopheles christyi TaxID=43041 RepID=A0A182K0I1_9DIPT
MAPNEDDDGGDDAEFSDKIFTRNRLSPPESEVYSFITIPREQVAMLPCAVVLIVHFVINSVQASCLAQYDQSATGTGVLKATFNSTPYCAYYGVRYAEPPIGNLRFRHSILHQPSGHSNYSSPGSQCAQYNNPFFQDYVIGDEDCLFANIYTPDVNGSTEEAAHPVLVFVHGGSYAIGHGEKDINGVDLLIDSGIVVVTFNYRLNVFGFLKSNRFNISGNFGLKDQTTLLRWVKHFIAIFGGDPTRVTLLGQSAGAGSVTHHLYIPQSKDLFQRMIVLSGSLLAPWSFLYETQRCTESYLNDLQPNTAEEFRTRAVGEFFIPNGTSGFAFPFASMDTPCFIPVQEQEDLQQDNFTVNAPHQSVLNPPVTKVPILLSETAREFDNQRKHIDKFRFYPNIPQNWTQLEVDEFISSVHNFTANLVAEGYANSSEYVLQQLAGFANMRYPMRRLAQHLAQTTPTYYLRFEFDGKFGKAKHRYYPTYLSESEYGATHGDDLGYIFSPYILEQALTDVDQYREEWRVHRWTVELIANFIKHGNPTPTPSKLSNITWPPLNGNVSANTYLNIDKTFEIREFQDDRVLQYWVKVYNCLYYKVCKYVCSTQVVFGKRPCLFDQPPDYGYGGSDEIMK